MYIPLVKVNVNVNVKVKVNMIIDYIKNIYVAIFIYLLFIIYYLFIYYYLLFIIKKIRSLYKRSYVKVKSTLSERASIKHKDKA